MLTKRQQFEQEHAAIMARVGLSFGSKPEDYRLDQLGNYALDGIQTDWVNWMHQDFEGIMRQAIPALESSALGMLRNGTYADTDIQNQWEGYHAKYSNEQPVSNQRTAFEAAYTKAAGVSEFKLHPNFINDGDKYQSSIIQTAWVMYQSLTLTDDERSDMPEIGVAFKLEMKGCQYDDDAYRQAMQWFRLGWKHSANHRAVNITVGLRPSDTTPPTPIHSDRSDFENQYAAAVPLAGELRDSAFKRSAHYYDEYMNQITQWAWKLYQRVAAPNSQAKCVSPINASDEACELCITGAGKCLYATNPPTAQSDPVGDQIDSALAPFISLPQEVINNAERFAIEDDRIRDRSFMVFNMAGLIDMMHVIVPRLAPLYAAPAKPVIDLIHVAYTCIHDAYVKAFGPLDPNIMGNDVDGHIIELILTAPTLTGAPDINGWIVASGDETAFRTWEDGLPTWTPNRDKATRYARRCDADSAHAEDIDAWKILPYVTTMQSVIMINDDAEFKKHRVAWRSCIDALRVFGLTNTTMGDIWLPELEAFDRILGVEK